MAIRGDSDFGGILRRCSTARSAWVAGSQWMRSRRQHQPDSSTALCCARQTNKTLACLRREGFPSTQLKMRMQHSLVYQLDRIQRRSAVPGFSPLPTTPKSMAAETLCKWMHCTWPKPTPLPHLPLFSFPCRWASCAPSSELALTLSSRRSTIGRQAGSPHHGYPRRAPTCQGAYFRR